MECLRHRHQGRRMWRSCPLTSIATSGLTRPFWWQPVGFWGRSEVLSLKLDFGGLLRILKHIETHRVTSPRLFCGCLGSSVADSGSQRAMPAVGKGQFSFLDAVKAVEDFTWEQDDKTPGHVVAVAYTIIIL